MQAERATWNDERLDDLSNEVRSMRGEMNDRFERLEETINRRFDKLTYGLIYLTTSLLVVFAGAFLAGLN